MPVYANKTAPVVHVYRVNAARLLVLPVVWLGFGVVLSVPLFAAGDSGERAAVWVAIGVLTLVMAPIFYFGVWRSRLELDEQGIVHFQLGYRVRSSWANVEAVCLEPGAEGLYLREPGTRSGVLRVSTRLLQWVLGGVGVDSLAGDYDALAAGRYIPLIPFTGHLGGGRLSRDLDHWAPRLPRRSVAS
jgi:hypothetical protein